MSAPAQCSKRFYNGKTFRGHQCGKPAKVERDGRHYCTIHDPEYRKAKAEKRRAESIETVRKNAEKMEAKMRALKEQQHKAECFDSLVEALRPIAEHGVVSAKIIADARAAYAKALGGDK